MMKKRLSMILCLAMVFVLGSCAFLPSESAVTTVTTEQSITTDEGDQSALSQSDLLNSLSQAIKDVFQ